MKTKLVIPAIVALAAVRLTCFMARKECSTTHAYQLTIVEESIKRMK